jgi:dUTP pyrophosphatase
MTDLIELRGLLFYGYHGALPEERSLGQRFEVDLRLGLDLGPAGRADDLGLTVNYAEVADAVRTVVEGSPVNLIEALAERIAARVLADFTPIRRVEVLVKKPSAPIAAVPSARVSVRISRDRVGSDAVGDALSSTAGEGGSVLAAATIRTLLASETPLIEGLEDPEAQIQPNGVDFTLESVWRIEGRGALGQTNAERELAPRRSVEPDLEGWFDLGQGAYVIRLRETVRLPLDVMAIGRPRSSLARNGASLHTAVWDAGYVGRSEALLVVYTSHGLRVRRGARMLQMVFMRLDASTTGYAGRYQHENLGS